MMNALTRYRPHFIRSLVYMAQASEYDVRDFLRWYRRTSDFAHVEKRKSLEKTPKALVLLFTSWAVLVAWCVAVMTIVGSTGSDVPLVVGAGVVVLTPFYFPYMFAGIILLTQMVQKPVERHLVRQARLRLQSHPAVRIAIAGSFGKTSMREILKTVLAEGKIVAAPPGSHNTPLGISAFVRSLKGDEEVLLFEMGEYYPGDIRALCEIVDPQWGIITGVNEAHLEKFGSIEKSAATIFELADYLKGKSMYVNGENRIAKEHASTDHALFSRTGVGEWTVSNERSNLEGISCTLNRGRIKIDVTSKLLGLHMVGPLAAAADIAFRLGIPPERIALGIAHTKPFAHRLEKRVDSSGVITLDDSYNGNPDGVAAVIDFLGTCTGHRRWYVTPGLVEMGSRKEAVHRDIGTRLARAGIEKVVLIRDSVTPYIEEGLKAAHFAGDVVWFDDMPQALSTLSHSTVSGDVVLIQNDWPDQYA